MHAPLPGVLGVDVSRYQPPHLVDYPAMRALGVRFMFARVGHSIVPDPTYHEHMRLAGSAGIPVLGAYQAWFPHRPIVEQTDMLVAACRDVGPSTVPVLDLEVMGDRSPAAVAAGALEYVERVEDKLGRACVVYTFPYFAKGLPLSAAIARRPLWIAHYGVKAPLLPSPWASWLIWQHDGDGGQRTPSGVDIDVNVFRGTVDELRAALAGPPVAPLPPAVHDEAAGVCLPPPMACEAP